MAATYRVVRIDTPAEHPELVVEYEREQAEIDGVDYEYVPCNTQEQVVDVLRSADIAITAGCSISRRAIEAMEHGRLIVCSSIGFDYVDVAAATACGLAVANLPLFCADEVADHAMALLLTCERKIVPLNSALKAGRWDADFLVPIRGLRGRVLGLIGAGNTARRVAARALPFGLVPLAYDPYVTAEAVSPYGITLVTLDELVARADYVSVHVPINSQTCHLLGEAQLRAMKRTAIIVNTSRGAVIDEAALVRALQEGRLSAAGLDVFEEEPLAPESPLLSMDSVVVTPHVAGYSEISFENRRAMGWDLIRGFVAGEWPASVINPQVKERITAAAISRG